MPLKVGNRGNVDEHILASLSMEPLFPHLEFNGPGRMLNYLLKPGRGGGGEGGGGGLEGKGRVG